MEQFCDSEALANEDLLFAFRIKETLRSVAEDLFYHAVEFRSGEIVAKT
jgi:hypothetical protein